MTLKLSDPALLKSEAYVDGAWTSAGAGKRFAVEQSGHRRDPGRGRRPRPADARAAIEAAARALPAWGRAPPRQRAALMRSWFELIMAAQEDLAQLMTAEQGKPLAETRGEVAYGASFIEWFAEEAKRALWRRHPDPRGRQAHPRAEAADRRGRRDHAVELPQRDDHPQGRPGARRRLHLRDQAGGRDAALGPGAGRARRTAPASRRASSTSSPRTRRARSAPELTQNPLVREVLLHRLDRDRQAADGPVRDDGEEGLAGARRQRAVHRLRRRRPRRGGRGRAGLEVPQHGPDLRLREPLPGPGRASTTRSPAKLAARVEDDEGRQRRRGRRGAGPADQRGGGREGRAPARRRGRRGGAKVEVGGHRHRARPAPSSSRRSSPASRPTMAIAREEIFGPVATLTRFDDEAEAIRLANDTEFGLAAYFYARDVGRIFRVAEALEYGMVGGQRRHPLHRGRPVRRREAVGHRPRGLEVRHRGLPRDQVRAAGRARRLKGEMT